MEKDTTVFVVSSEDNFRESVVTLVHRKGLRAEAYASPDEFLSEYNPGRKGCIVIGIGIGTGDSPALEVLLALKERQAVMPVVVAARKTDVPTAVQSMRAGAANFLEKPTDEELSKAIDRALEIEQEQHVRRRQIADIQMRLSLLTDDEQVVLRRLLAGQANKQIAADLDIGLRTVELRRAHVMRKMEAASLPELVRMAILLDIVKL